VECNNVAVDMIYIVSKDLHPSLRQEEAAKQKQDTELNLHCVLPL